MITEFEVTDARKQQFPITALREIKILKMLSHVNVLQLEEMAIERNKAEARKRAILYMVTPYMEHDLSGLLDNPDISLTEPQIKCYMIQLLQGLRYLHNSHILHRDMKAANLLISNRGILQIADFGLARQYDEPVPRPGKGGGEAYRDYTQLVVTRWYRPPELLLHLRRYTTAIDMWGAGCVFGEMFKRKPILAGNSDLNQAHIIFDLVGSPTEENMPGWSALPGCEEVKTWKTRSGNLEQVFRELGSSAISLLRDLLKLDWRKRSTAVDALEHPYFKMDPKPARPGDIPPFPDSHELDRRNARGQKAALPPAPAGGTVGGRPNGDWGGPNDGPYSNGDRHYRGSAHGAPGWAQDRGPPGVNGPLRDHRGYSGRAPLGYDQRGPPPPHRRDGPGWQDEQYPGRSGSSLPPPPPEGSRHPLPRPPHRAEDAHRADNANSKIDTYIPSYSDGPRRSRERDLDEPPPRDRDRYERDDRDRDRRRHNYRDPDAPPDRRDRPPRRTRSRSPDRSDRTRERDRDVYRR